jgi:uncharacterized protein (TIGR02118 family)
MQLTLVSFNFKGADLDAEERHYLSDHVGLARSLPGLRLYLTGRMREIEGQAPERLRSAILAFDDAAAAGEAMRTPMAAELMADTQAHLKDLRSLAVEGEFAMPFASRRPGAECFVLVAEFDFKSADRSSAERGYMSTHVELAKKLPGLRGYLVGRTVEAGGARPERQRVAILAFDNHPAFRDAFRSEPGRALGRDGAETLTNVRTHHLDARIEL